MATKANNHPLVKALRKLLDDHHLDGAMLIAIDAKGRPIAVSAGKDVARCNALGRVLDSDHVGILQYEMDEALIKCRR